MFCENIGIRERLLALAEWHKILHGIKSRPYIIKCVLRVPTFKRGYSTYYCFSCFVIIWMLQLSSDYDTYLMLGFVLTLFLASKAADWIVDKATALIAKITRLITG